MVEVLRQGRVGTQTSALGYFVKAALRGAVAASLGFFGPAKHRKLKQANEPRKVGLFASYCTNTRGANVVCVDGVMLCCGVV